MRQATRAGLGIAVLPAYVGDGRPDLERLTEPELSGESASMRRSARIRLFMREITALIATQERRLLGIRG